MSDEPTAPIPTSEPTAQTPAVDPTVQIPQAGPKPAPEPDLHFPSPSPRPATPRTLSKRRYAALAAFAEALIPRGGPIPHSASDVGVAERVDAALATFDPIVRKRFSRLIGLWDWLGLFSRYLRPFSRLSPQAQAAFCDRASRSRSPVHRNTFTFLKLMCLNQWASTPPVEDAIGFTYACVTKDPPRDGEALEVLSWPAIDRDHTEEADAVVIGSGAGGAAVAKELAEAGLSVVVLEEGGYFTRKDFTGPPWERLQRFYRANGSTIALGVPTIPLPLGKAVGGTTLINSGTCFRTPDRVLNAWGSRFGIEGIDPESMRPFFDRVERILHVKPVPEELLGENARVFRRGVQALGLHGEPIRRNIDGCRGCGVCAFGCPSDAKQATHISYLPRAQKHGASIYVHTRADRIIVEDGRARGVVASMLDPSSGEPRAQLTVNAKVVVVAAGAIHSPALLQANAIGNRSGEVGRNLRIHPAAGIGAWMPEDVYSWRGTLQPFYVDDWHESHDLMIEVTSSVPGIGAGTMPGSGLFTKELLGQSAKLASAGVFVSDTSSGRVRRMRRGEPLVTYRLNKLDTRKLVRGMVHVAEIFFAAGAGAVYTGIPGKHFVRSLKDLEDVKEEAVRPGALRLTAFHPVGTARMGAEPSASVVGQWGECHDVAGLFVADGSVLPGCPTVNPQITIMAFATRTADHMVRHGARYFS
ncbi:MAG: GMC family oxidoreductase N-terminal domain-containing protein [Actinomycetota bacterium]